MGMRERLRKGGRGRSHKMVKLYRRQGGICTWCDKPIDPFKDLPFATIDHVIPKSHGGPGTYQNSALLHEKCNLEKGDQCPGCDYCKAA